ncbi:hypothetical protein [Ancylomarina longa]
MTQPFITYFKTWNKKTFSYPHESDNTMLFSLRAPSVSVNAQ